MTHYATPPGSPKACACGNILTPDDIAAGAVDCEHCEFDSQFTPNPDHRFTPRSQVCNVCGLLPLSREDLAGACSNTARNN